MMIFRKLKSYEINKSLQLEGWSRKDDSRLYADKAELLSLKNQTEGFQWLMQNQKDSSVLKLRQKFYVLASHAKKFDIKDLVN